MAVAKASLAEISLGIAVVLVTNLVLALVRRLYAFVVFHPDVTPHVLALEGFRLFDLDARVGGGGGSGSGAGFASEV